MASKAFINDIHTENNTVESDNNRNNMAGGGPVYQPTTVSYEPRTGGGLLGQSNVGESPLKVLRKPKPQVALLLFALIALAAGAAMLASGIADLLNTEDEELKAEVSEQQAANATAESLEATLPLGILIGGSFMTLIGILGIGLYVKVAGWRRHCICPSIFSKKQTLARQLQGNSGNQIMALNPSTDPLVSHTQYAPVCEVPQRAEDEERRNLMPDNKDCLSNAEESERMLEPDPRIVLRPVGRLEDV